MKTLLKPLALALLATSSFAAVNSAQALPILPIDFSIHASTGFSVVGAPIIDRILTPSDDLKTAYNSLGISNLADKVPSKYKNWTKGFSSILPFPINYGSNYEIKGTARFSIPLSTSLLGLSAGVEGGFGYYTFTRINQVDSIKNYASNQLETIDKYIDYQQSKNSVPSGSQIHTHFKDLDFSYLAPDFSTGFVKLGVVAEADLLGFIGRASVGYLYTNTDPKLSSLYYGFYLGHTILFGIEAGVSFEFTGSRTGLANFYERTIKNDAQYKKIQALASSQPSFKDAFNKVDNSLKTIAKEYADLSYKLESINFSLGYRF